MKSYPMISLISLTTLFLIIGCENQSEPTSSFPQPISNSKLLTPQQDGVSERDVQINQYGSVIYYNTLNGGPCYQWIDDGLNNRHELNNGGFGLKLASDEQYIIYKSFHGAYQESILERMDLKSQNHYPITSTLAVFDYCISPNSEHIAYFAYYNYPPNTIKGIYVITPDGDTNKVLITESANATPICWLSNHELIVRENDFYGVSCDILKFDTDFPGQPGEFLYHIADATNYPLGYSEAINVNEGWYIDSFYASPEIQWGKNLYKCPIGSPGDYGEQLTEGGNNDYPGNLAADGHTFVFSREYRDDYEFSTGHRDIYLMHLDQIQ